MPGSSDTGPASARLGSALARGLVAAAFACVGLEGWSASLTDFSVTVLVVGAALLVSSATLLDFVVEDALESAAGVAVDFAVGLLFGVFLLLVAVVLEVGALEAFEVGLGPDGFALVVRAELALLLVVLAELVLVVLVELVLVVLLVVVLDPLARKGGCGARFAALLFFAAFDRVVLEAGPDEEPPDEEPAESDVSELLLLEVASFVAVASDPVSAWAGRPISTSAIAMTTTRNVVLSSHGRRSTRAAVPPVAGRCRTRSPCRTLSIRSVNQGPGSDGPGSDEIHANAVCHPDASSGDF